MKTCLVCRRPYYRRNQSIVWTKNTKGAWIRTTQRGHPECLKLYANITRMYQRATA